MKQKVLLFIPGYMGSSLREKSTNKVRWVRISDFFSNVWNLRMTESFTNQPKTNDLYADAILENVKIIPKLIEVESYDNTLKELKKFCADTNRIFDSIPFDWRDDFIYALNLINDKIVKYKDCEIEVVGHSTGGLLLSYYLRYGNQDFLIADENWEGMNFISKAVIVASPLRGAFSIFRSMTFGTAVLRNKKMLNALDYSTFKSSYFFLPLKEFQKAFHQNPKKGFIALPDMHELLNYKKYFWALFKKENLHELNAAIIDEKFDDILKRSKKFNELLHAPINFLPENKSKIFLIRAYGRKTAYFPTIKKDLNFSNLKYPLLHKVDGDGIVADFSSKPIDWMKEFNYSSYEAKEEHLKIITKHKHLSKIFDFLKS